MTHHIGEASSAIDFDWFAILRIEDQDTREWMRIGVFLDLGCNVGERAECNAADAVKCDAVQTGIFHVDVVQQCDGMVGNYIRVIIVFK